MILGMTVNASHRRSLVDLGRAVRAARERRNKSIAELASNRCSPNTWTKVEHGGYVHPSTYDKIADALRVPAELVAAAASSPDRLTELVTLLDAGANYFPDPAIFDDRTLWNAYNAIGAELYARFWHFHDEATGRSPGRPRIRGAAPEPAQAPAASLDPAGRRTEQERPHGMG
jgi:transcriptional regulator with XRE-family HTH domain